MSLELPIRKHVYRNHHLDSTRWDAYEPRDDDIVISTSIKSGTTWTQSIVRELVVHQMTQSRSASIESLPAVDNLASPWIDASFRGDVAELHRRLEKQAHRRFLKTHLPLDGLPYYPQVKYLVVGRDPRDVFISLWNHYRDYKDDFYALLNNDPKWQDTPFPRCPADIHQFWQEWIGRGWFEWEREGYPYWGNMHHAQTWWDYRHLDNLLFVHYADLLADQRREIRRIAHFLGIETTDSVIEAVVEHTQLAAMRQRGMERDRANQGHLIFRGGASTFFNKGINGRWQEILSADELAMYEETKRRVLSPTCAEWLEHGQGA